MRSSSTGRRAVRASFLSIAVVTGLLIAIPSRAAVATAFIRVNQVGYPDSAPKRAYLMASDVETGGSFALKAGGTTVFSASIGADQGSWSQAYPHVYALDFASVAAPGTYTIEVTGPIPATSPSFRIDGPAALYATALANSRSFYENERDGADFVPSALRTEPSHLNDENAMTYLTPHANSSGHFTGDLSPLGVRIDASGGWWDAGDYVKFVQTTSYTVDILMAGVRDFPAQLGSGSGRPDGRGSVRRRVAAEDVGRPVADALLPGRHRYRERQDRRRSRHLATAAGRRHVRRHRPAIPLHPQPAGLPGRTTRLADQPEPGGARRRGPRRVLPGVPRVRPGLRGPVPDRGRAHLRSGRHGARAAC